MMKRIHWAVFASLGLLFVHIPLLILVLGVLGYDSYWSYWMSMPLAASLGLYPAIFIIALAIETGRKAIRPLSKSAIGEMLLGSFLSGILAITVVLLLGPGVGETVDEVTRFEGNLYFISSWLPYPQHKELHQCNSNGLSCKLIDVDEVRTFRETDDSLQVLDYRAEVVYTFDR